MVHHGFSTGCQRCRDWHVKCDETRPSCKRCIARGIECPGPRTAQGFLFKDQSAVVADKHRRKARTKPKKARARNASDRTGDAASSQLLSLTSLKPDPDSTAVNWFFETYLLHGRNWMTSRGHFDNLVALYRKLPPSSPLALATIAMAGQKMQLCLTHGGRESVWHHRALLRASHATRNAIGDPVRSRQDETLLAVLLLDFAEQMTSRQSGATPSLVHHRGALALVRHRGARGFQTEMSRSLLAATRSNTLRKSHWSGGELTNVEEVDRACRLEISPAWNPAVALDGIIDEVQGLQRKVWRLARRQPSGIEKTSYRLVEISLPALHNDLSSQALLIESSLRAWKSSIPATWHPTIDPATNTEAYSALDIAYLYNQWRCTGLQLLSILHQIPKSGHSPDTVRKTAQALIESILASVPFFLDDDQAQQNSNGGDLGRWYLYDILRWALFVLDRGRGAVVYEELVREESTRTARGCLEQLTE